MARRTKTRKTPPSKNPYSGSFIAYYCTVGLFLFGWAIPEARVWGINWFAYQPTALQAMLVLCAASAGPFLWWGSQRMASKAKVEGLTSDSSRQYWGLVAILSITLAGLYFLFSSTTHFLGDGYSVLTRLAEGVGSHKSWDIGASMVNDVVFDALGAESEENALLTFRLIAVGSGLLMLVLVAIVSSQLFDSLMERGLFFLGMASSGYVLHFFGYVENYALFIVMIIAFTLFGLLATLGKMPRWLAIIPALLACGLHIFGVALLPALLYVLLFDRKPLVQIDRMTRRNKTVLIGAIAAIAVGAYFFLFYNYYFFRFAFLPLVPDRFTVDDDYLLSIKHLTDVINLLVMLVPGVGLLIVEILADRHGRRLGNGPDSRFLLLLLASTMACIYLFNPGIGMPRNWDLFSLPGIPLSVLVFYTLLSSRQPTRRRFLSALLAVSLGFLLIVPRVSAQWIPEIAIKHFKNYVDLDRTRNRNARSLLTNYYRTMGDEAAADRWNKIAVQGFPEASLTNRGKQMLRSGNIDQAEALFRDALRINPIFVDARSNLGTCFINRGQLDEALEILKIADGLNPLNASVINNKGTVYLRRGDLGRAEEQFGEVLRIEPGHVGAMAGLVSVNVRKKDDQRTSEYLKMIRSKSDLQAGYFEQGVEVCMEAGLTQSARLAFGMAVERGSSLARQQELIAKYPELSQ